MRNFRAFILNSACAGLALLSAVPTAAAQDRVSLPPPALTPPKPKPAAEPAPQPAAPATTPAPASAPTPGKPQAGPTAVTTAFDPTPITLEDPPLTLLIPKGCKYTSERAAGVAELQISPPDQGWIFRIFIRGYADRAMTTSEVMKAQIDAITKADEEARTTSTLLEHNRAARLASRPCERVYYEMPSRDGKQTTIRGISIVKSQPGHFLFVEVVCDKSKFEAARVAYEDTLTTISVADPAASAEKVASLVKAGAALLASVTDEDLKQIVAARPDRWERFYQPAKEGGDDKAVEIGYRRVQTGYGKRSQFAQFSEGGADDNTGFFVRIDSRIRMDEDFVDMQGIFFLSADRKEELWTLTLALKSKGKTSLTREIGARHGDSMTVTTTNDKGLSNGKPVQATIPPEGYISRVEHYLLPQILVKKRVLADFGFYTYYHDDHRIKLRTDRLSTDKAGKVFDLETSLRSLGGEKTLVQNAEIRENGELISLQQADGATWEPATVQRLLELWKAKGLPL